ncbi:MAG: DUF6567 family protein [Saprospiraceae bacterium]
MRKTINLFMGLILVAGLSSCGINRAWVLNQNQLTTQVQLARNNFKVVGEVRGTADVSYVLVFGGVKKKQLYEEAYAQMIAKADLGTGSRALINVTTEEHVGGVPPLYYQRTLTVKANVVEFID